MDNRGQSRKIIFISKWKLCKEEVNFGNVKNLEIFTTNASGMELELILEDLQPEYIILTYCDFDTIRMVELSWRQLVTSSKLLAGRWKLAGQTYQTIMTKK